VARHNLGTSWTPLADYCFLDLLDFWLRALLAIQLEGSRVGFITVYKMGKNNSLHLERPVFSSFCSELGLVIEMSGSQYYFAQQLCFS
jgi:hypothetical protein